MAVCFCGVSISSRHSVLIMADGDGKVQNMCDYGKRLVGGGMIGEQLRDAASLCPPGEVEDHDQASRDDTNDACVLPPSSRFLAVVVNVLANTKRKPR